MVKKITQDALNNRAELQQAAEKTECYPVVFLLRDNYHEFTLGLDTVLQCLHFAEEQGAIPPIPDDWWYEMTGRSMGFSRVPNQKPYHIDC